jgi:uroporphyrinogen decarboxylase
MDNFLMDLLAEPEQVERLLDALMEVHLGTLDKVCRAVGDVVDVRRFGDDLGADTGPFMAPATYRALFKPRHRLLCEYVRKNSQMKTFLPSCGSIYSLLPDLIECVFGVINPVQTACHQMEPERLKGRIRQGHHVPGRWRRYENRAQPRLSPRGQGRRASPDRHPCPRRRIRLQHDPNILPDVPPENFEAMFEAVAQYGGGK